MRNRTIFGKVYRRCLCLWAALCLLLCGSAAGEGASAGEPLSIVALNFPGFDFARHVAGADASVTMLLKPGADSHSYEPSPKDILAIQNADLFIYTGGESDTWVERILLSLGEDAPETLRMTDVVTLLAEEHTASMQADHAHDHGEEACDDPEHHHEAHAEEMDEHVWTAPLNAAAIVDAVAEKLCLLRPEGSEAFLANAADYTARIREVDEAFRTVVAEGKRDLIIFGDRFPLRYFAAAYGLRYDAAFPGCSEDSEPSVRTVISLVDTVREEQIPVVFHIEYSSQKTARILAEETGAKLCLFHGCHTVSAAEIEAGATYVSLMLQNVQALKEALN